MSVKENSFTSKKNIFDVLPPQLLADYTANGRFMKQSYGKGEIIHLEGDLCKQVELVICGEIAIERIGASGDLMTINRFGLNSIIGANLIFSSADYYPMTITAKSATTVMVIPKDLLFELCNQYPSFLLQFIQIISDLSVLIGTKVKNRVSRTIRESIIAYINKQYQGQKTYTLELSMSKKALSEMFGISRTSLSRELQKMKEDQLIDFDAKTITIINKDILD